jgi:DNA-binding Xre family transcriptional regulator
MLVAKAVASRIVDLCEDRNISINKLAIMSGLTQSTIQSIISGKSKNPKLLTIVRICESLEMKLSDFFEDKIFENLDSQL